MDAVLKDQFERVETALNTLVESIASYNPSPQAAFDLVAADDDLSHGLDQLSRHQANHTRILNLRAEAEALETQLKSSVSTLASLRTELFDTPASSFSEDTRLVPFNELMQYAKNISKYTVPPTYREAVPKADTETPMDKDKDLEDGASAGASAGPSTGVGTPTVTNAALLTAPATATATANPEEAPKDATADGTAAEDKLEVTPQQAEWLKKLTESKHPWVPWPDHDKIRRGNLMMIQHMLDQGKDPWTDKVPTQQEFEEQIERQRQAEEEQKAQAEQAAQAAQEPQLPPSRKPSVVPAAPKAPAEQFTGFDFDDDD